METRVIDSGHEIRTRVILMEPRINRKLRIVDLEKLLSGARIRKIALCLLTSCGIDIPPCGRRCHSLRRRRRRRRGRLALK